MDRYVQQCQEIFERSQVMVFVWRLEVEQWRIEFVSENTERILGCGTQEILAEDFPWSTLLHPEDVTSLEAERRRFTNDGEDEWLQEYRLKTRSNQFHWFREQGFVQAGPQGSAVRVQSIVFDISDYKQTHEALRESEAKFKNLAEQSPNMIFINQGGKVVYVNEKCVEVMGYQREEFYAPDFNFLVLVSPEYHDTIRKNMRRHTQGMDVPPLEYAIVTKTGRIIDVILSTQVIRYEGNDGAILGTVTDITERKQAEKEIVQYQQRLRSLTSELARAEERQRRELASHLHDGTCQELALIKMQLQSLVAGLAKEQQAPYDALCTGLTETMENLRDLTFDLSPPALYTSGLYAALEYLVENQLKEFAGIAWNLAGVVKKDNLPDDARTLIYMSVRELLINVVKHAHADKVTVECEQRDGNFVVSVADNGRGFDFQQQEPSHSGGFGLFNIQERLEYFGGTFAIQSEPGQGSTITLTVPKK